MNTYFIQIPKRIQIAIKKLQDAGYEAFVVGGCVRDSLLGKEPNDWDITTSAVPEKVKEIFQEYKQVDSGLKHGTTMVIIENNMVEITTFRIDGNYSDGRRPDYVSFTSDIKEDLSRRDFTINACAATESILIDPYGGQEDLKNHRIQCVGNPQKRFKEDALRILRGIRFSSELNFYIEQKTKEAMFQCHDLLSNVSQERITSEFCKTLLGINVKNTLTEFKEILIFILPEIKDTIGFQQRNPHHVYDVFEHILRSVEAIESDLILRTTMLFHDIAKPRCFTLDENGIGHFYGHPNVSAVMAKCILQRMRFSSSDIQAVTELIQNHDKQIENTPASIKRVLNELGEVQFKRLLKVKKADIMAQNPKDQQQNLSYVNSIEDTLNTVLLQNSCFSLKDLSVNGDDLMKIGIPEGKHMGDILNTLLNQVMDEKLENNKEGLLEKALTLYN